MIQDIFPQKLNNRYDPSAKAGDNDVLLCIADGKILIQEEPFREKRIVFPRVKELSDYNSNEEFRYLFTIDDAGYFLQEHLLTEEEIPAGYRYVEERGLRIEGIGPKDFLFAAITAKHLADWYGDTKFCGRCGHQMVHSPKERAMTCEACHYTAYPRIMPAVIVGVINGDKILLTKYRTGFKYNALIAGFTEIGETVEETVQREVMEEAGIKVKNIRYYKSQPWGSANDILLGFYCDVDGDDTITMDAEELKYAEWVQREQIELQPGEFSLTNEMMKQFKEGHVR